MKRTDCLTQLTNSKIAYITCTDCKESACKGYIVLLSNFNESDFKHTKIYNNPFSISDKIGNNHSLYT